MAFIWTIISSEERAELQELVDGIDDELTEELTSYYHANISLAVENLKRIAEILGLEVEDK